MNGEKQHGESSLEQRRVQRLGASSLIITLPKKWANMLGIRVGDTVYLKLAKNHIKIIPNQFTDKNEITRIIIGKDLPVDMARVAISCLYILGVDEAIIDLQEISNKEEIIFNIKGIAQELIGMDVLEQNGKLIVKVFIDKNKIDINTIISNYKNLLLFIINLLNKIIYQEKTVDKELEVVKRDLIRYQHLLLRFIKEKSTPLDPGETSVCSVSTGTYLGMAIDALIGTTHVLNESLKRGRLEKFSVNVNDFLDNSRKIITLMVENVLKPDSDKVMELRKMARILFNDLEKLIITNDKLTKSDLLFISSMMQFARVINIYTNVVACRLVELVVRKDDETWIFY